MLVLAVTFIGLNKKISEAYRTGAIVFGVGSVAVVVILGVLGIIK